MEKDLQIFDVKVRLIKHNIMNAHKQGDPSSFLVIIIKDIHKQQLSK